MKQNGTGSDIENVARLIRASYQPDARPHPQTNERTYRLVVSHLERKISVIQFPDIALGILGFILVLLAGFASIQLISGFSFTTNPPMSIIILWLALNLLIVPIAGAVIVIRRQHG